MASISESKTGTRRIQFTDSSGQRKTIYCGRMPKRQTEAIKVIIENLVSSTLSDHAPSDKVARQVNELSDQLHSKLSAVGLIKPRKAITLESYVEDYIDNHDVTPGTIKGLNQAKRYLVQYFDAGRQLKNIDHGQVLEYRKWLKDTVGLADNTLRRYLGRSRQFFKVAVDRGIIAENPFLGVPVTVRAVPSKLYFITTEEAEKVLGACPCSQWRLLFALCRWGGLRNTSETLSLKWSHVLWDQNKIVVPSPKTAHVEGHESRVIPLFPEILPHLMEVFEQAEPGTEYVITRYRTGNGNLRTQFQRIIEKAGLVPWGKPFQNLRSSRETELLQQFPLHVVTSWLGNSPKVALQHYTQVTDSDFEKAIKGDGGRATQNATQQVSNIACSSLQGENDEHEKTPIKQGVCSDLHDVAKTVKIKKIAPAGFEPATNRL